MKITPNQVFLHEADRYEESQDYEVDNDLGSYFVNVGWADTEEDYDKTLTTPPARADEDDLEVHDSTLGQES